MKRMTIGVIAAAVSLSALATERLQIGVYGFDKNQCNEEGVLRLKDFGADFAFPLQAKDKATLDLFAKYGLTAVVTGVVPSWWGGSTAKAGRMAEYNPLSAYADVTNRFMAHPAICQVDIGDEPGKHDLHHYAKVVKFLNEQLPGVEFNLNLLPSYASHIERSPEERLKQLGTTSYSDYIRTYCQLLPTIREISIDHYPYSAKPAEVEKYLIERFADMSTVARYCRQTHRDFAFIPQLNSLFKELPMDLPRLRYQAFTALAFGVRRLTWACYSPLWWEHNPLDKDGKPTPQWEMGRKVNREIRALTADYMRFRPTGVRFIGFPKAEATRLGEEASELAVEATPIRGLKSDDGGRLVIGEFAAADGSNEYACLVAAADDAEGKSPKMRKVRFFAPVGVKAWNCEGPVTPKLGADGRYELDLPSDGALFIETRREVDVVLGDDQLRFLWHCLEGAYGQMKSVGFNCLIENPLADGFWKDYETVDWKRWHERMSEMERDGISYIYQCYWGHSKEDMAKWPRIGADGKPTKLGINASEPGFIELTRERATAVGERMRSAAKSVIAVQTATEIRDTSSPDLSEAASNRYFAATGRMIPAGVSGRSAPHWSELADFPKDRIVDMDYPLYAYYRWFWKVGDGWNAYHSLVHDTVSAQLGARPAFSLYDPGQRTPPMWGSGGNVGSFNEWSYLNDEPCKIAFVTAEQQAMARGSGKQVLSMIQGFGWRREMMGPNEKASKVPQWAKDWPNTRFPTMPPDVVREGMWWLFSRQIDGIGFHGWNSIFDGRPFGQKMDSDSYAYTHPGTEKVISNLFHTVAIPFGPYFRAVPECESEVALLESEASALFCGNPPWDWRGKPYACGVVAMKAKLSPSVIYEDEIVGRGIPSKVKVLLMPDCSVLTRGAYEVIRDFQLRGGKLVADDSLVPALKADGQLSDSPDELAKTVAQFVEPKVMSDRGDVLVHARQAGSASLVFAINDRREFGDYSGPWGRVREVGVPNSGTVSVRFAAGAVYDLIRHQSLAYERKDGITSIKVDFQTTDGRALLFCKRALAAMEVKRNGELVTVSTTDRDVMLPICIQGEGVKPIYGVVKDGCWSGKVPAGKVRVQNLANGAWAQTDEGAAFVAQRQAFAEMRFGVFIHWGLYANYAQGEWYVEHAKLDERAYSRMRDGFCPSKFDAREWVRIIKNAGAKYITITSRHHDGFSLWPTKVDDGYNIANTPFKRDILGELAEACKEEGIQLNFYYSLMDWHRYDYPTGRNANARCSLPPHPEDYQSYKRFMLAQLTELLDWYHPGNIWFDGEWDHCCFDEVRKERVSDDLDWELDELYDLIHSKGALVANNNHMAIRPKEDIQLFERDLPGENGSGFSAGQKVIATRPIEQCDVIQKGVWGYKIGQKEFRTPAEVVAMVARAAAKGSNLLMNIGPDGSGQLPQRAVEVMAEVGKWFAKNGDSIYGTTAGGVGQGKDIVSTRKGGVLYLHFLNPKVTSFEYAGKTYTVDRSDGNEMDIVVRVD